MMPGLWTRTAILAGGVHCWICNRQRPDQVSPLVSHLVDQKDQTLGGTVYSVFLSGSSETTAATQCCEALSKP
ncbi:hypothetical protein BP00DRAFT_79813 [Aspergillus indologenus CBS 114.80]|uniref:Uncharacterized protein n=1 Tax=Aspergillus indologenus CBS 114.80 TaxID=1450541 RepID=A0A2V5HN95_9EURO|nr:hypothetical protein BP00DRAFT_79813 [Aspergillus indologenus CBS 114.80]